MPDAAESVGTMPPTEESRPSLAMGSVARFVADSFGLGFGFLTSILLARSLGPSGKGTYSAITFLFGVAGQTSVLGIEEAVIIMVGRKRLSFQAASVNTFLPVLLLSLVGAGAFTLVAWLQLTGTYATAITIGAVTVPLVAFTFLLTGILNSRERIVFTSIVRLIARTITIAFLVVVVLVRPLSVQDGIWAEMAGFGLGALLLFVAVKRGGVLFRPHWDNTFLKGALKLGVPIQMSRLVTEFSARVDLLLVYTIVGSAAAGLYSIALTIGQLVIFISLALNFASFPRLASLDEPAAAELTTKLARTGLLAATILGALLAIATPFVVPAAFGNGFAPVVAPALVLIVGGLFWGEQLILCRALAARAQPGVLMWSFGTSLVVMLALDAVLIPTSGIMGAAAASDIGCVAGLWVCLVFYRRAFGGALHVRDLIPRAEDARALAASLGTVATSVRSRLRRG